jgi:hypothetical protein
MIQSSGEVLVVAYLSPIASIIVLPQNLRGLLSTIDYLIDRIMQELD